MKKEILFAIIIGLLMGLVITYGIYTARTSLRQSQQNQPIDPNALVSPQPSELSTLVIASPADESVQTKKEITISGTTLAQSYVIVFINDSESITTADESGNFSVSSNLVAGSNIITIHSVTEDGNATVAERTVTYLTGSFTDTPVATASAKTASPSPSASPKATAKPTVKPTTKPATGSATR